MNGRLIFDLTRTQPISGSLYHGGGIYGIIVLKRLIDLSPEKLAIYFDPNRLVDQKLMDVVRENGLKVYKSTEISIKNAARKEAGVIYSPIFNANLMSDNNVVVVSTIHDLRNSIVLSDKYENAIDTHKRWESRLLIRCGLTCLWYKLSKKKRIYDNIKHNNCLEQSNNRFVTVSETSKYALLSIIPSLKETDIKVLYSPDTINYDIFIDDYINPYGKYYLLTSADRWIKNPVRAIIALDELFSERKELESKVVITGLKSSDELKIKLHNSERFVFLVPFR